jgi:hypothetical protein
MADHDPSGASSYSQIADHAERWLTLEADRSVILSLSLLSERVNADVEDVLLRAAAFETGAVESLYEAAPGATRTIVEGSVGWEDLVDAAGDGARRTFEDQYAAYKFANE